MPATRSFSRVKLNVAGPPTNNHLSDDDIIIISSDEENVNSAARDLRRAQQEIRSLRKKLSAKETPSSQVLMDQRNYPAQTLPSPESVKKLEGERLQMEACLQKVATQVEMLKDSLAFEKSFRIVGAQSLEQRAQKAEKELASLRADNNELNNELSHLSELHAGCGTNNDALRNLEQHILCELCIEKLWLPYTLPGCGHTFCQRCLTDWFNAAVVANAHNPQYTCPACRTRVLQRPVEDYALKGVVRAISELIDPAGGSPPRDSHHVGHGPWHRFFR